MPAVDTAEWLDAIHAHYERNMSLPALVGAELLRGKNDAATVFESLVSRGALSGDPDMADIIEDDVDDAIEDLIAFGFLEDVLSIDCSEPHDHGGECEEHMLEFRIPGGDE